MTRPPGRPSCRAAKAWVSRMVERVLTAQMRVKQGGVQRAERAVAAARVVADQDVQVAERVRRRLDEPGRSLRKGQVEFQVVHAGVDGGQGAPDAGDHGLDAAGILAPGLVTVVRRVVVQEQAGAQRGQPAGYRVADSRAAADPGDQGGPAAQRERVTPQLIQAGLVSGHPACGVRHGSLLSWGCPTSLRRPRRAGDHVATIG